MGGTDPLRQGGHDFDVDGVTVHYTIAGSGPICVIHSGGPGVDPNYLRMPLLEKYVTAVYLDPIGTGASGRLPTHPHGYTMAAYGRTVETVIEHLGGPRAFFLGHSAGGFVGQHLAVHRPDLLAGLVLYDSAPTGGDDLYTEATNMVAEFAARFAGHPALDAVLTAWRNPADDDATDDDYSAWLRRIMPLYFADFLAREDEFGPLVGQIRRTVVHDEKPFDCRGKLDAIDTPTLIVVGSYDFICPPVWAQTMHDDITASELALFENSGHLAHLEEPVAFAAAVGSFVERNTHQPDSRAAAVRT